MAALRARTGASARRASRSEVLAWGIGAPPNCSAIRGPRTCTLLILSFISDRKLVRGCFFPEFAEREDSSDKQSGHGRFSRAIVARSGESAVVRGTLRLMTLHYSLQDRVAIASALGHASPQVVERREGHWNFVCACGYRSTRRRTSALAQQAGIHHLRVVADAAVARANGRSPAEIIAFSLALEAS